MDVVSCQCGLEEVNRVLSSKLFLGIDDEYFSILGDISDSVLTCVYHMGIAKCENAQYREGLRAFKLVSYFSGINDLSSLAIIRSCICYAILGESYIADSMYDDLIRTKYNFASRKGEAEFGFLVAQFMLLRNKDLFSISALVRFSYYLLLESGNSCVGFINIVQSIKEKALLMGDSCICNNMDSIIASIIEMNELPDSYLSYLNTYGLEEK